MHGFHRALEKRLTALEARLGAAPTIETEEEMERRHVLVRCAHRGHEPEDLTPEEGPVFARIVATVPIVREIRDGGLVGDDGEPQGGSSYPDPMLGEIVDDHEDGQGDDQGPVWEP